MKAYQSGRLFLYPKLIPSTLLIPDSTNILTLILGIDKLNSLWYSVATLKSDKCNKPYQHIKMVKSKNTKQISTNRKSIGIYIKDIYKIYVSINMNIYKYILINMNI